MMRVIFSASASNSRGRAAVVAAGAGWRLLVVESQSYVPVNNI